MSPTDLAPRPPRSRRRLLTAGALVAVAVLGSGVAWRLSSAREDATSARRPAPSVRAADVRRWINPGYEPGDLFSHAYRLPPVRAPWPGDADAGDTLDTSTAMPPVPGLACGSDVRKVPRPAAIVSITRADMRRLAVVTGWGQGIGRRRFAEFVAGEGPCLWFAPPRPIARARWVGDEGWLALVSPAAPAGVEVGVQAFAIERLGDVIVAVEASGAGAGAGAGNGAGSQGPAEQLAEQAAQWADALAQQLLASHHPALTGQMPVAGEDAPVRYVVPTPDLSPSAGNPLGDRVQPPAGALPPGLLLLGTRAQRPAAEHLRADCGGRQVPDGRTAARTWVYERGGPGVGSAMVIVEVSRWPTGQGTARFTARRGWGDACDALTVPSTPVPSTPVPPTSTPPTSTPDPTARGWVDARHVLLFRPSPAWQARALVGDDVVSVEVFVQDQRLAGPQACDLARRIADAFAARLR